MIMKSLRLIASFVEEIGKSCQYTYACILAVELSISRRTYWYHKWLIRPTCLTLSTCLQRDIQTQKVVVIWSAEHTTQFWILPKRSQQWMRIISIMSKFKRAFSEIVWLILLGLSSAYLRSHHVLPRAFIELCSFFSTKHSCSQWLSSVKVCCLWFLDRAAISCLFCWHFDPRHIQIFARSHPPSSSPFQIACAYQLKAATEGQFWTQAWQREATYDEVLEGQKESWHGMQVWKSEAGAPKGGQGGKLGLKLTKRVELQLLLMGRATVTLDGELAHGHEPR